MMVRSGCFGQDPWRIPELQFAVDQEVDRGPAEHGRHGGFGGGEDVAQNDDRQQQGPGGGIL
ncbi:MAG: hypothetical protein PVI39_07025 [Desulfobacteraceae bacterium]|jgi:hypothetical protein